MNQGWGYNSAHNKPKGLNLLNEFRIIALTGITDRSWPLMLGVQVIMMSVSYVRYNFRAFEPKYYGLRDRVKQKLGLMLRKAVLGILRYTPY